MKKKDFYRYVDIYTIYFRDGNKKKIREAYNFNYLDEPVKDKSEEREVGISEIEVDGIQVKLQKRGLFGRHQLCVIDDKTMNFRTKYWEEDIEKVTYMVEVQKCFYTFSELCRQMSYDKIIEMVKDKVIEELKETNVC